MRQALIAARQDANQSTRELAEALLQIAGRFSNGDATANRALTQWLFHAGQVSRDLANIAAASGANPVSALTLPNLVEDFAHSSPIDQDMSVYECRFEALPSTVVFRPPRITPWPVMRGSQTARVVGPSGEVIHTDQYGRVRVQFNWDREGCENGELKRFGADSSCWIRVSQGMAGGGYGMMFLPRVGQEVVVDFLEGDPDQPLIVGRVYNADHMPPYKLPDEKTKSVIKTHTDKGGGTNEIRFEDLKDKEQILIHAQKDMHLRVTNDYVENVDHDKHLTVKENVFELVNKAKNVEVKLDLNEKLGGNKSLKIAGDRGDDVGGSQSIKTGQVLCEFLRGEEDKLDRDRTGG
ncbi:MAG: type VI secretion system tip protein VgrG [Planctomycetes bacterium]|nr:type VI secretion system tip protein VgrG [Planctomycetota bacterium]